MLTIQGFGGTNTLGEVPSVGLLLPMIGSRMITLVRRNPSLVRKYGVAPMSSSRRLTGDRSCQHFNFEGQLDYSPDPAFTPVTVCITPPSQAVYPYNTIVSGPASWDLEGIPRRSTPTDVNQYKLPIVEGTSRSGSGYEPIAYAPRSLKGNSYYWTWVKNFAWSLSWVEGRIYATSTWQTVIYGATKTYTNSLEIIYDKTVFAANSSQIVGTYTLWRDQTKTTGNLTIPLGDTESPSFDSFDAQLNYELSEIGSEAAFRLPPLDLAFTGPIKVDAINACKVIKTNLWAFACDLKNIKSLAGWAKGLPDLSSASRVASSYLGYKYGASAMLKDSVDIVHSLVYRSRRYWRSKAISRSRGETTTAVAGLLGGGTWERKYNFKLYYRPIDRSFIALRRSFLDYGVMPTAKNIWDLIPFSFVVDWMLDVGGYLEQADADDYLNTLDIIGSTETEANTLTGIPGSCISPVLRGSFSLTIFRRTALNSLVLDPFHIPLSNPSTHWVEGAALFLQRSKF